MNHKKTRQAIERAYDDGFVEGIITARYYWLRYPSDDENIRSMSPSETPEVLAELMSNICTDCLANLMFEKGWGSLDALLLCDTKVELAAELVQEFGATNDRQLAAH